MHSPDEHLAPTDQALQADPQHNVRKTGQSTSEIGDGLLSVVPLVEGMDELNDSADAISGSVLPLDFAPPISTPSPQHHKRKTGARTPVVEDEVRKNARLRRNTDVIHIQLENEPRKRRGAAGRLLDTRRSRNSKWPSSLGRLITMMLKTVRLKTSMQPSLWSWGLAFVGFLLWS
jgi:hypothetical protein